MLVLCSEFNLLVYHYKKNIYNFIIMTDNNVQSSDMEKKVIELLASNPKGTSQTAIQKAIPSLKVIELAQILNALLSRDKINLLKRGNQTVYAWKTDSSSTNVISGDVEEKLIFEAIKRAGNNGIAPKELKIACNLPQPRITKILKGFESRKLVKAVTSNTKRKLFLLYDLEPSAEITGGTFYSGEEFETEFVNVLGEQCYRYLLQAKGIADKLLDPISQRRASFKSSTEICEYINGLKISKVELKMLDIEKILESLIYDAKIEKSLSLGSSNCTKKESYYAVSKSLLSNIGLMRMPCGVCQVYEECGVGREVSPSNCPYMKTWLEEF